LDICFCKCITNDLLKSLPKLPALQRLALDGCQEVDDQGLFAVAQRCQWLQSLSLYWNTRASDKGFSVLMQGQKAKDLKNISFSGCKQLSDETMQHLVSIAPDVEVLDLTRCNKLSDAGVLLVCETLDKLRILRLYAMAHLSPAAFTSLQRLTHLEELDLCGCLLKDKALLEFFGAVATSKLQKLNLTWCLALTDATAFAVARHCPKLAWLSYFGNLNITDAGVEALANSPCRHSLRELDVRGLTKAPKYSADREALLQLLPRLVCTKLHS
jgi:F-box/leucine-rich repeat protein 2/20